MTLVLIAASLIFFLWVLSQLAGSVSQAVREAGRPGTLQYHQRDLLDLIAEKRAALIALKESELDYETGKVGDAEYEEVHAAASSEAIAVMQRLDEWRAGFRYGATIDRDLVALTDAPAAPQRGAGSSALLVADDDWEEAPALSPAARARARRQSRAVAEEPSTSAAAHASELAAGAAIDDATETGGFCVACGTTLVAGAKFCGECGHQVGALMGEA